MTENQPQPRDSLLAAALWFVETAVRVSGVQCIALIGSIVTDRQSPKDVDFMLYIADDADLAPLAAIARRLQGRLQSQNRGADVFLADERLRYLGRTCPWKVCGPGVRASCDALHCGCRPYLHDDLAALRLPDSLIAAPPVELWPVVVHRCKAPADVEEMVSRLQQPHDDAVERRAGSRSLAAAAYRERPTIEKALNKSAPKVSE